MCLAVELLTVRQSWLAVRPGPATSLGLLFCLPLDMDQGNVERYLPLGLSVSKCSMSSVNDSIRGSGSTEPVGSWSTTDGSGEKDDNQQGESCSVTGSGLILGTGLEGAILLI